MKAGLLVSGSGALVYLTSHEKFIDEEVIEKLKSKGFKKFISYEIPVEEAKKRYGGHFNVVLSDIRQTDDLRILDYRGGRAFNMFSFEELGPPFRYEEPKTTWSTS